MHLYTQRFISLITAYAFVASVVPTNAKAQIVRLSPESFQKMYAIGARGDIASLSEAVHRGLRINAVNENGDTGLCVAVKRRDVRAYRTFLAAGAAKRPSCSWKIPHWETFVDSVENPSKAYAATNTQTGATYATGTRGAASATRTGAAYTAGTRGAAYGGSSGSSIFSSLSGYGIWPWVIGGGVVAVAAVALAGGGGGGGSDGEPGKFKLRTPKSNEKNLTHTDSRQKDVWGGIYTAKSAALTNLGNITLTASNFGTETASGFGILSCSSASSDCLLESDYTGENITNSGDMDISTPNSLAVYSTGLLNTSDVSLNALKNTGNLVLDGTNVGGIGLRGHGLIYNEGSIRLTTVGTTTELPLAAFYNSALTLIEPANHTSTTSILNNSGEINVNYRKSDGSSDLKFYGIQFKTYNGQLKNNGNITMTDSALSSSGTAYGIYAINHDTSSTSGQVTNSGDITINGVGTGIYVKNMAFENSGKITATDNKSYALYLENSETNLTNSSNINGNVYLGGSKNITNAGTISSDSIALSLDNNSILNNTGTITKITDATLSNIVGQGTIQNEGTIQATISSGNIALDNKTTGEITSGTTRVSTLTNAGKIEATSLTSAEIENAESGEISTTGQIKANSIENSGTILSTGVVEVGELSNFKKITTQNNLTATTIYNRGGAIDVTGTLTADSLENFNDIKASKINLSSLINQEGATLTADKSLEVKPTTTTTTTTTTNNAGTITSPSVIINGELSNSGTIQDSNTSSGESTSGTLKATGLDNFGTISVANVTSDDSLANKSNATITAQELTATKGLTNSGTITSTTVTSENTLTNSESATITANNLTAKTLLTNKGTLTEKDSGEGVLAAGMLVNSDAITLTNVTSNDTLTNYSGATITAKNLTAKTKLINSGTINATQITVATEAGTATAASIENAGRMTAQELTTTDLTNQENATLIVECANLSGNATNYGNLLVTKKLETTGTLTNLGAIQDYDGEDDSEAQGTLSATTLQNNYAIDVATVTAATAIINNTGASLFSKNLTSKGTLTNNNRASITATVATICGDLTNNDGASMKAEDLTVNGTLENSGTLTTTKTLTSTSQITNAGTLSGETLSANVLQNDGTIESTSITSTGTITNYGTLKEKDSGGTLTAYGLTNTGTIDFTNITAAQFNNNSELVKLSTSVLSISDYFLNESELEITGYLNIDKSTTSSTTNSINRSNLFLTNTNAAADAGDGFSTDFRLNSGASFTNEGTIQIKSSGDLIGIFLSQSVLTNAYEHTISLEPQEDANTTRTSVAIYATDESILNNTGSISATGKGGTLIGAYLNKSTLNQTPDSAQSTYSTALNVSSENATKTYGIYAKGNSTINLGFRHNVNVTSTLGNTYGIYAEDSSIQNHSNINVTASANTDQKDLDTIYGIYAYNSSVVLANDAPYPIKLTSKRNGQVYGIYAEADKRDASYAVTTNSTIDVEHRAGIGATYGIYAKNMSITSYGDISVQGSINTDAQDSADVSAYGVYLDNSDFTNTGSISVTGTYLTQVTDEENSTEETVPTIYGIYATNSSTVTNAGTISLQLYNGQSTSCSGTTCTPDQDKTLGEYFIYLDSSSRLNNASKIIARQSISDDTCGGDGTGTIALTTGGSFEVSSDDSESSNDSDELTSISLTNVLIANEVVANDFSYTYTLTDAFIADKVDVGLTSESVLFEANLAENQRDVVLTMNAFEDLVENDSIASFLSDNYAAENNESLYSELKSATTRNSLNAMIEDFSGHDLFSRMMTEDTDTLREFDNAVSEHFFTDAPTEATNEKYVRSAKTLNLDASGAYALNLNRTGDRTFGVGMSLTNLQNRHGQNKDYRQDEMFMVSAPMGITRHGWSLMTAPRLGYAYGSYTRTGHADLKYDGTMEKRIFGLANAVRYPLHANGWTISPMAEFNLSGYRVKAHEKERAYSLDIPSQNIWSVESGFGLAASKTYKLGKNERFKLQNSLGFYHEFADPYSFDVNMHGMSGAFRLKDEKRSTDRAVLRTGFDYTKGNFSLEGSLLSLIDREYRGVARLGLKYNF